MGERKSLEELLPADLTEEELQKLEIIKTVSGKGWIRNFSVKTIAICPNCGEAKGWTGDSEIPGLTCSNCGYNLPWSEWTHLKTKLLWEGPF